MSLERLIADLASDQIDVDSHIIHKARKYNGKAFFMIAEKYHLALINRQSLPSFETKAPRMIAWYLLSADEKYPESYFRLAYYHIIADSSTDKYINAMKWYLLAVKKPNKFRSLALDGIASIFEHGHGVSPDKHRSLEWYYKYDSTGSKVNELNKEGYHLTDKQKAKTLDKLVEEAQYIYDLEMYKYQPLEVLLSHQKEVKKMKNRIQSLEQQLKKINDKMVSLEVKSACTQKSKSIPSNSNRANNSTKNYKKKV